jgi:hypothetical protein
LPPVRDEFRQAQRELLENHIAQQQGGVPTPDGEAARKNAQDRVQARSGPDSGDMQTNQAWANDYNKAAQERQAEIHASRQEGQRTPEHQSARDALDRHEAADKSTDRDAGRESGRAERAELKVEQSMADRGVKPNDIER